MRTADAQADLSLRWAHMPFCWFCHEAAHLCPLCFPLVLCIRNAVLGVSVPFLFKQNRTELYYDLSIYSPSSYYTKDKAFINAVHTRNVCNPVRVDTRLTCVGVNKVNNY